jgi:DNA-binding transcriptional LysR family regulator
MFDPLFSKSGLSLDRLRTFCLVADAGSIARAAGRDAVRQSQFSRQIKELEEHFEVELVRRAGKGLALTGAGLALARTAREQLGALADYASRCRALPVAFRLGAGDTLLRWLVMPRLAPRKRERIVLETLGPSGVAKGLRDSTLDFGLAHAHAGTSGVELGRVRYQLHVPRALVRRLGGRRDPAWLAVHAPMAIPFGDEDWTTSFARAAEPALACDTFPQAWCAVESGQYAAVLPDIAKPAPNTAVFDWPALHHLDRTIHLVWSERAMRARPGAEALRAWLKGALKF